ncbi:hypothetical protein [Thermomonas sp.]|uniref:hypothetical protein n=1 Tax=Thermomonas sp. TaxID=1971895 RepID=UPI00391A844A
MSRARMWRGIFGVAYEEVFINCVDNGIANCGIFAVQWSLIAGEFPEVVANLCASTVGRIAFGAFFEA